MLNKLFRKNKHKHEFVVERDRKNKHKHEFVIERDHLIQYDDIGYPLRRFTMRCACGEIKRVWLDTIAEEDDIELRHETKLVSPKTSDASSIPLQNNLDKIEAEIKDTGAYEQEVNGTTQFLEGINYCLNVINKYKKDEKAAKEWFVRVNYALSESKSYLFKGTKTELMTLVGCIVSTSIEQCHVWYGEHKSDSKYPYIKYCIFPNEDVKLVVHYEKTEFDDKPVSPACFDELSGM